MSQSKSVMTSQFKAIVPEQKSRLPSKFKAITDDEYAGLDEETKFSLMKGRHQGIIESATGSIYQQLMDAMVNGKSPEKLCAAVFHHEDPMTHDVLRALIEKNGHEIGVFAAERENIFVACNEFKDPILRPLNEGEYQKPEDPPGFRKIGEKQPYLEAGKKIMEDPPPGHIWIICFAGGMATIWPAAFREQDEFPGEVVSQTTDQPAELPPGQSAT